MGKKWDTIKNYQKWCYDRTIELLRVLKPGGYCLVFGGTRTHHRLVCAFEDAGFLIKDEIAWMYSQGFPKSYNISKGFDKKAGAKRKKEPNPLAKKQTGQQAGKGLSGSKAPNDYITLNPVTKLAKQWDGWGTALKPAHEPIMVAQKPYEETYCYNIEKYGVGGINIDDSRIKLINPEIHNTSAKSGLGNNVYGTYKNDKDYTTKGELLRYNSKGRFPANVILDKEAGDILDEQTGVLKSGSVKPEGFKGEYSAKIYRKYAYNQIDPKTVYADSGGASRFFYCAKTSKKDRTENGKIENKHPTVKPTDLIKYLIRLVTPPECVCLDICEGSGTHAKACLQLTKENYPVYYIGFENDKENYDIALQREQLNKI